MSHGNQRGHVVQRLLRGTTEVFVLRASARRPSFRRQVRLLIAGACVLTYVAAIPETATHSQDSPSAGQSDTKSHPDVGDEEDLCTQQRAFRQVKEAFAGARYGWVFLPRSRVLSSLQLPQSAATNVEQPLLRWLAVDVARSFGELSFVAFALDEKQGELELTVALPEDARLLIDALSLASTVTSRRPITAPLTPPGTLVSISGHADWNTVDLVIRRLADQSFVGQLGDSANELEPLLRGLGAVLPLIRDIHPDVHLVIARQSFSETGRAVPPLRLPAVALIVRPQNPGQTRQRFTAAYLAAMMQANEIARREGRPRLKMQSWKQGDAFFAGSSFGPHQDIEDVDRKTRTEIELLDNVSPAIGIAGGRFILSSGQELAADLVRLLVADRPTNPVKANARIAVGPVAMAHLLVDNAPWLTRHLRPIADVDRQRVDMLFEATGRLFDVARAVELPATRLAVPMNLRVIVIRNAEERVAR